MHRLNNEGPKNKRIPQSWLFSVPGKKKLYIVALILVNGANGVTGVLEALLLRNIVDSAVTGDSTGFWYHLIMMILLLVAGITLRAIIRWLTELSKATFENIFKGRLVRELLGKDFATVSAIHSGEWMNRITNDTVVVAEGYVEILPGLVGMIVRLVSALVMIIALDVRL